MREILTAQTLKIRAEILSHFVKIAKVSSDDDEDDDDNLLFNIYTAAYTHVHTHMYTHSHRYVLKQHTLYVNDM